MDDFEKEWLDRMEQISIREHGKEYVKRDENRVICIDHMGNEISYFFDHNLYQKIKHDPIKMYPYILKWYDGEIDYLIEAENEASVRARITTNGKLEYLLVYFSSSDYYLIKKFYDILKEYIENKKEYRIRIKMEMMEIEISKRLEDIIKKVAI